MIISGHVAERSLKKEHLQSDLVIVGGGMSGVCTAITAARKGIQVILVQDRPVLGGNASSEVRLWILGATAHMGNNNRWSREGGVIDEILVENTYRNPEGNPVILDMLLLEKVSAETNITLLLNTAVYEVSKKDDDTISFLTAFCSQNSIQYRLEAPLYCDASGDGIVGFLSGAAFRMGAEDREEFGEPMAPDAGYGELLGHSLYFYTKDTGKPVSFTAPAFALDVTKEVPRFKSFNAKEHGCKLWWVEYGGRLDTVHDTEKIKWELWRVIYGVWDYIKNSGKFPEADTLTLEWVGTIPGKRESRRFEGDYILTQADIIEQRMHKDAVAFGGWAIDLHPADGVFSERQPCNQWHSTGLFQIPYRSLYSRNIKNLFLTGRIISVSHVAFGATRVMATSAYVGQSVAMAAVVCSKYNLMPAQLVKDVYMTELQNELVKSGQYIPGIALNDKAELSAKGTVKASSSLVFKGFSREELIWKNLSVSAAQIIPFHKGKIPAINTLAKAIDNTTLIVELRASRKKGNFTPETVLASKEIKLTSGEHELNIDFEVSIEEDQYMFITFLKNEQIELAYSKQLVSALVSAFNGVNKAVSNNGKQVAPENSGVETFEFWCPQRRPEGHNIAVGLSEPVCFFEAENIRNGFDRPDILPNVWISDPADQQPELLVNWKEEQIVHSIQLSFDTDFNHPMESVLMTHPETVMPFCIRSFSILDEQDNLLYEVKDNYQTIYEIIFKNPVKTKSIKIRVDHPSGNVPAAIFSVRIY